MVPLVLNLWVLLVNLFQGRGLEKCVLGWRSDLRVTICSLSRMKNNSPFLTVCSGVAPLRVLLALCSVWICSFLRSKVDANNYMIPETYLVNSSWWETRNVVNGWFDIAANKEKGPGNSDSFSILFKPHFVPEISTTLNHFSTRWLSRIVYNPVQPNAMHQQFTLRSTSLQTSHSVGLESRGGFYFHLLKWSLFPFSRNPGKAGAGEGSETHWLIQCL